MLKMKNNECTILVCSCDKYADLLRPFSDLWRKFWPDCPFDVMLVTETEPSASLCFDRVIACGPGGNWCSRLVRALGQIDTPYVLMLCDDYYLAKPVDTSLMLKRLSQIKTFDAANLRMIPNPTPKANNSTPFGQGYDLLQYKPHTAYCIATQSGFWNRKFLLDLAKGKSSIWEFERYGSFDPIITTKQLLVTPTKEFPFVDAVHKGYWETFGLAVCRENGIDLTGITRTLPPFKTRLIEGIKALIFRIVPTTLLVRFQNRFALGATEAMPAGGIALPTAPAPAGGIALPSEPSPDPAASEPSPDPVASEPPPAGGSK